MSSRFTEASEWIEADGLGGFASGPVRGPRTRRYHSLLLAATTPPTGRFVLVNDLEARVTTSDGSFPLTVQRYTPDVLAPGGAADLEEFRAEPWPRWRFNLADGTRIEREVVARHGSPIVLVAFRLVGARRLAALVVRPLLSGRDYHALHRENPAFCFRPDIAGERVVWRPYPGVPGIAVLANGRYEQQPAWYRNFLYAEEQARGLDCVEDLAAPGVFHFDLSRGEAILVLSAATDDAGAPPASEQAVETAERIRSAETRRRSAASSRLHRAADAYLVRRGEGLTIAAGYPWFVDWGRDTFIALRGLCLATGRLGEARSILLSWAGAVSEGMLPNRFPDRGELPEYNSVDASLWYIVAVRDYLRAVKARRGRIPAPDLATLRAAVEAILDGYARGTRYGIRLDDDGLLAAGVPGVQLTWMDAKVGDWVVTPRIGKPVEVEALWLNALTFAATFSSRFRPTLERGLEAFPRRFWNEEAGCLYDVVDTDHRSGAVDPSFRPNQILAVGGLPLAVIEGERARRVVEAVESRLLTPMGLRSLAPAEPGYAPRYEGGVRERDGAYHQGTVWPWLIGPFVEAWLRVHGDGPQAKREARDRFLAPLLEHLDEAGVGHLPEIADAEPPHAPRGCPFQAWSVGEALRIDALLSGDATRAARGRPVRKRAEAGRGGTGGRRPRRRRAGEAHT
jgi:predicted glycogen debranching enzyme